MGVSQELYYLTLRIHHVDKPALDILTYVPDIYITYRIQSVMIHLHIVEASFLETQASGICIS
jgi:hypothetical protein